MAIPALTSAEFQQATGYTPADLVEQALKISNQAAVILRLYRDKILEASAKEILKDAIGLEKKADDSPLTNADRESSTLIESGLSGVTPNIPVVSEENDVEPDSHSVYWAIDPLDGTKTFIEGKTGFAINIALMIDGSPALGVVNCPAHDTAYFTATELPTVKIYNNKNERRIIFNTMGSVPDSAAVLRTVFDAAHGDKDIYDEQRTRLQRDHGLLIQKDPTTERVLQFNMMLIEGMADVHIKTGKDPELKASSGRVWDNAADHILLRHAGGGIVDLNTRKPLEYNFGRGKMPAYAAFARRQVRQTLFPTPAT